MTFSRIQWPQVQAISQRQPKRSGQLSTLVGRHLTPLYRFIGLLKFFGFLAKLEFGVGYVRSLAVQFNRADKVSSKRIVGNRLQAREDLLAEVTCWLASLGFRLAVQVKNVVQQLVVFSQSAASDALPGRLRSHLRVLSSICYRLSIDSNCVCRSLSERIVIKVCPA